MGRSHGCSHSCGGVDQFLGATQAKRHRLDLGHDTVWHITEDWSEARVREQGWRSVLEAAGAPVPDPLPGDWSPAAGYQRGRRLLQSGEKVTVVFVANDQMALGVMRPLYEAEMEVPPDISIVGFDDIPEASYFAPPLTTVRQEFLEVGTRSRALLLRSLRGEIDEPLKQVVEPVLVLRAGTAPPGGGVD